MFRRLAVLVVVAVMAVGCVNEEKAPTGNPAGPIVGILGDSITCQSNAPCGNLATDVLHPVLDPTYQVQIDAMIGRTILATDPFVADLVASHPSVVIINLGTNQTEAEAVPGQIAADYATLAAAFRSALPGVCLLGVTVKAQDMDQFNGGTYSDPVANDLNVALPSLVDHVVDWNAALVADPSLSPGQPHPGPAGRLVLAQLEAAAIPLCSPPPEGT